MLIKNVRLFLGETYIVSAYIEATQLDINEMPTTFDLMPRRPLCLHILIPLGVNLVLLERGMSSTAMFELPGHIV